VSARPWRAPGQRANPRGRCLGSLSSLALRALQECLLLGLADLAVLAQDLEDFLQHRALRLDRCWGREPSTMTSITASHCSHRVLMACFSARPGVGRVQRGRTDAARFPGGRRRLHAVGAGGAYASSIARA
jgi:hypothetical protein